MSLSGREQETLDRIEDEIAGSDSNLAALLNTFTRLTAGEHMPDGEEVKRPEPRARFLTRLIKGASPQAWLPAAIIVMVTVLITVTAALSGGGRPGGCAHIRGLACARQVTMYPSTQRSG